MFKTILILWVIFNLYVFIKVSSFARREILWAMSFGKIKRHESEQKVRPKKQVDDDKPIKLPKPIKKKDLWKQCKKEGMKCDGGYGCEFSQQPRTEVCNNCPCLGCTRAICLPALGDKNDR